MAAIDRICRHGWAGLIATAWYAAADAISPDIGSRWRQVNLWCDDWQAAEQMAVTHLGPLLIEAEHTETITSWWFVRKGESWRLRVLPTADQDQKTTAFLGQMARGLTGQGAIRQWPETIYEPEIHASADTSPLRSALAWPAAFQHTGCDLADLAQQGSLTRGLRAVLTHHVLFAWNRLGIAAQQQQLLATTAGKVVFQEELAHAPAWSTASPDPARLQCAQ